MKFVFIWFFVFGISILNIGMGIVLAFFTPKRNAWFGLASPETLKDDSSWEFANKTYGLAQMAIGGIGFSLGIPLLMSLSFTKWYTVISGIFAATIAALLLARYITIFMTKRRPEAFQ